MKQFYSPLLYILFAGVVLMTDVRIASAQTDMSKLAGTYMLDTFDLRIDGFKMTTFISKEMTFFSDHILYQQPLKISRDGILTYSLDLKPATARMKIAGDEMKLLFNEGKFGEAQNFTVYKFKMEPGKFTLSRTDPRYEESYTFKKQ